MTTDDARRQPRYHFDRHAPGYRGEFETITRDMQSRCPVAWSETYGGHWVAAGNREVFELARAAEYLSNDHDVHGERRGYRGITIPPPKHGEGGQGGFLEMDPPEQRHYRQALNPYLSPAAVRRWVPFMDEVVRAALDERIESGRIDFVDDLANVVPAVLTLAMLGIPLANWKIYNDPVHASVYTPPDSPDSERLREMHLHMWRHLLDQLREIRRHPRPGMIDAVVTADINGRRPDDDELLGVLGLLIGGGFDTTTALTAHSLEWLGLNPHERGRLIRERDTLLDSATEEFLRFFTPAPGDGRTIAQDCELAGTRFHEGDRLWLSWAMANRDPAVFPEPNRIDMARPGNRHYSFGLGIHRCIGSNLARVSFKRMITAVLDRLPDYTIDTEGTVHYATIGVIQGMRHLPAAFTPGERTGAGLDETLERLQRVCDTERLAEPVTVRGPGANTTE
ncbi:cytochrome P450 [Yinghuangia sp. ASG 101]|uniref:cytochrome P450 n=1 Tax=Yinghuangia sp. ASG 101 TaxID=2896848 RepID=UPI001E484355|nr:cytochrome P450 [Yinghuangia sp. ASG 101]UGQ11742.1 cytochrome P450 [Yinghuangia sp. ASG 101]